MEGALAAAPPPAESASVLLRSASAPLKGGDSGEGQCERGHHRRLRSGSLDTVADSEASGDLPGTPASVRSDAGSRPCLSRNASLDAASAGATAAAVAAAGLGDDRAASYPDDLGSDAIGSSDGVPSLGSAPGSSDRTAFCSYGSRFGWIGDDMTASGRSSTPTEPTGSTTSATAFPGGLTEGRAALHPANVNAAAAHAYVAPRPVLGGSRSEQGPNDSCAPRGKDPAQRPGDENLDADPQGLAALRGAAERLSIRGSATRTTAPFASPRRQLRQSLNPWPEELRASATVEAHGGRRALFPIVSGPSQAQPALQPSPPGYEPTFPAPLGFSTGAAPARTLHADPRLPSAGRASPGGQSAAEAMFARMAAQQGMAMGRAQPPQPPQHIHYALRPFEARMLNVQLTAANSVEELLHVIAQHMHVFNAVNASTAIHKCAKLYKTGFCQATVEQVVSSPVFRQLCSVVLRKIENGEFGSRNLANTLWGFSTLKRAHGIAPILRAAATECCKRITTFNCQELANTIWAYATLSFHPGDALCEDVAMAMVVRSRDAKPQELSNCIWSFATLGVVSIPLMEAVAVEAEAKLCGYNAQNISNTCWAYATLGYHPAPLFEAVATAMPSRVPGFNPQALSNTAWAYASLGHYSPVLMNAIGSEMLRKLALFNRPQAVGNCLWAFASLKHHPGEALLQQVTSHAMHFLGSFQPADVSMILWSLAALDFHPGLQFLEGTAVRTQRIIAAFGAHEISNLIFGFGQLGHHPGRLLLASIAEQVVQMITDFNPLSLSILLMSFAMLDERPSPSMLRAVQSQALSSLASFAPLHVTNLLWAHAHLRADPGQKLLDDITQQVQARIGEYEPTELANLVWSFGRLGCHPSRGWLALIMSALETPMQSPGSGVLPLVSATQLAWALAGLGELQALDRVIDYIADRLDATSPSPLSNVSSNELCMLLRAATVATCDRRVGIMRLATDALAAADLSTALLENIAEAMRALSSDAHAGAAAKELFCRLQQSACALLRPLGTPERHGDVGMVASSEDIGNTVRILWSSADRHAPGAEAPSELLRAASKAILGRCATLHSADQLSVLMWSFAKMGHFPGAALCDELCQLVAGRVKGLSPTHAAFVMWALAEFRYAHPAFDKAAALVAADAHALPWSSVCMAARACAKMEPAPRNSAQIMVNLLAAAGRMLDQRREADDMAALAWAAALSDVSAKLRWLSAREARGGDEPSATPLAEDTNAVTSSVEAAPTNITSEPFFRVMETACSMPVRAFSETGLCRLAVASRVARALAPSGAVPSLMSAEAEHAARCIIDRNERHAVDATHGFCDEVKQSLGGTGMAVGVDSGQGESESLTPDALARAPLTLTVRTQRVAIMLISSSDTLRNARIVVGQQFCRCLLLELAGWAVIQIKRDEWPAAGAKAAARLSVLEQKLRAVLERPQASHAPNTPDTAGGAS
mmetsp:Transcript_10246/g.42503  ORF Transcript_10246/g.42503 Transcript_10246/m.42503 type:complete len:1452 (-) Transcript_10246:2232-6587(-)